MKKNFPIIMYALFAAGAILTFYVKPNVTTLITLAVIGLYIWARLTLAKY